MLHNNSDLSDEEACNKSYERSVHYGNCSSTVYEEDHSDAVELLVTERESNAEIIDHCEHKMNKDQVQMMKS